MKKLLSDLVIRDLKRLTHDTVRMVVSRDDYKPLPAMEPGQFVNIAVPDSPATYLRRPISINRVTNGGRDLHLVIKEVGEGTRRLAKMQPGSRLNILLPLGNGFPTENVEGKKVLLIGGGVGTAPLLFYGEELVRRGAKPVFLLGARKAQDFFLLGDFNEVAPVCLSTEDGSLGVKGLVTQNEILNNTDFAFWVCCGPAPMMKAVARIAKDRSTDCYVSLENMMACGLGACLCCVEKTVRGNVCVCTNGPVFNINELTWS